MNCAHCQQPIRSGEEYEDLVKFSASGGGVSMRVHTVCPRPVDSRQRDWARRAQERQRHRT